MGALREALKGPAGGPALAPPCVPAVRGKGNTSLSAGGPGQPGPLPMLVPGLPPSSEPWVTGKVSLSCPLLPSLGHVLCTPGRGSPLATLPPAPAVVTGVLCLAYS